MKLGLLPFLLLLLDAGGDGAPPEVDESTNGDDQNDDNDGEEIRDPKAKIHALEDANARLHKKIKERDERIAELESNQQAESELSSARLEAAFLRSALKGEPRISDVETAWTLATAKGFFDTVKIGDDGVEGMPEAMERLVSRYPYLANEDVPTDDEEPPGYGGRPVTAPSKGSPAASAASLAERFPALRRRHRGR